MQLHNTIIKGDFQFMEFKFTLTKQETEIIINGLANLPYRVSAELIQKFDSQIKKQFEEKNKDNNEKEKVMTNA